MDGKERKPLRFRPLASIDESAVVLVVVWYASLSRIRDHLTRDVCSADAEDEQKKT